MHFIINHSLDFLLELIYLMHGDIITNREYI